MATYDYRDESGELLYQAVRFDPKDFRQRKPDGNGGWAWSVKGVRLVPFRLVEVLAADPASTVYIVEGEKDVLTLASLGMTATCNAGGAGKWRDEFSSHLAGRNIVIIPDADEPGEKHAAAVARSLAGKAASVRVLRLPGAKDVSDWIAAGGTVEVLCQLADAAPLVGTNEPVETPADAGDDPPITNANVVEIDGKPATVPKSMGDILESVRNATDDWPRRVGPALFVDCDGQLSWLNSPAAVFGFLGTATGRPARFTSSPGCHTREDVFHELRRTATAHQAVEVLPHEPPIAGHYYACQIPEPGDGAALRGLMDRFCPETDIDRDLIKAMFASVLWGGTGGTRPAFLIDSADGRGAGKSKLAAMVGQLAGGVIELSANEDAAVIKQRLLSADGLTKRVAILDNVKSMRFSWAELESLITTPTVSGKALYIGEASRPNNLTWIITLNGASLSTDMAQRCVIIRVKRPAYDATWEETTRAYIDHHRQKIIGDLIAFLRSERSPLDHYSRWATWERDVLSRLPEPADAQKTIAERQGVADVESEEADIIEDFFRQQLDRLHYQPDAEQVFIPGAVAARWFNWATGEKHSTTAVTRTLKQKIDERKLPRLSVCPNRHHGRGFYWTGRDADPTEYPARTDVEIRLADQRPNDA